MKLEIFKNKYIDPFYGLEYIYIEEEGYIVWRVGTGENIEMLHLRTFYKKRGFGKKLVLSMLDKLKYKKPYHSIYAFTRTCNIESQKFFDALGFNIQHVNGIYKDGQCVLFWASYDELYNKHIGEKKR
jgi:ribosomal protein S18 acetylase RimI-like enzyme